MSAGPLDRLFAPATIAVVGASPTPGKAGNALMRTLGSFSGRVYPVHPRAESVNGVRAYPRVAEIPEPVDLALIAVPAQVTAAAVRECAAAGVGAVVVHAGGFAETGEEGLRLQEELLAAADGPRLLGPNTSGFIAPPHGLAATFVAAAAAIPAGPLAIVAQSGGVNHALAFAAARDGIGVRLAVGLGNAPDVGVADVLDQLDHDDGVRVVGLALEGVRDGGALLEAVGRLVDRVPVVALKVGRSDAVGDFARSHTGALAGSWAVTRSVLRQAGAVIVDDTTEMLDACRALGRARLAPHPRPGVGVLTGQAGPGLLLADTLGAAGVPLPTLGAATQERLSELLGGLTFVRNPVDTGRPGPSLGAVLKTVQDAEEVDLVAAYFLDEEDALDPVAALGGSNPVPVLLGTAGPAERVRSVSAELEATGVPVFPSPERTARAAGCLLADAEASARRRAANREPTRIAPALDGSGAAGDWDEDRAKSLLASIGIASPQRTICATEAEALAATERLGFPVAIKLIHTELIHKTEAGAVHLGLATPNDAAAALGELRRVTVPAGARYLVEKMASSGPELLLAAVRDPAFGPLVVLGAGGVEAEILDDVTMRLAPVPRVEAESMLGDLATAARFHGYRGAPVVDQTELVDTIVALGDLLASEPALEEIEINPLRVTAEGLLALDAFVSTSPSAAAG